MNLKNMDLQEIWVDIKGYEGLYQISNKGRVKAPAKKSGFLRRKEKILSGFEGHSRIAAYVVCSR